MSLLLNALKKAEEGEKKDGQSPAPESEAQASGASAPAADSAAPAPPVSGTPAPVASGAGAPTPAPAPATPPASGTPTPAAPAARPGGLTGGGLSLKKPATPAPAAPVSAIPTPATAAAERMAGPAGIGGGMGLKKTAAAPPPPSPPDGGDATEDEDRSKAGRILRGSGSVGGDAGEEDDAPRFRGLRNFLAAAALLAAIGGGGYFTLEAGFIPGMSVDSVKILVGWSDPPPPRIRTETNIPELNVADGAVLRLPRPAIDVQSEIDFTDVADSPVGSEDREEYVQRIAVLTGYNAAKEAREQRERAEQEAQLAESLGDLGEQDLTGLVDLEEESVEESPTGESAAAAAQRLREPLSDEVFTAAESRAEKARLEALTPSEEDIHIISASEKIALVAAAEAAMETEAMEAEAAPAEGEAVAQADGESAPAPAESESETVAETESAPKKMETMEAPKIVTPSLEGEKRREMLERAKAFYLAGRLNAAEAMYRNVLRADQNNLDAMRGIAQIALSSGRRQLASTMYTRILNFYPGDPIAIAELANLQTGGDPLAMERRIRSAIGTYPESDARLYFSLGNLYAERRLWSKAQEAYFEAVSLEGDNPDYVYNLAVVLDYLNKPALAAQYYRRAVDLAEFSPSGFNLARTRARIQDLEQ